MAERNDRTTRDQAEGERSTSLGNRSQDETEPAERYDETSQAGGGITNRPLDEEVENQDALPQRGQNKNERG